MTNNTKTIEHDKVAPDVLPNKADIRASIFSGRKPKSEIFEFFGVDIELRQPKVSSILSSREDGAPAATGIIDQLIENAYVPGTDDKVFIPEDADALKDLPFGADYTRVAKALERLTEVNFPDSKSA